MLTRKCYKLDTPCEVPERVSKAVVRIEDIDTRNSNKKRGRNAGSEHTVTDMDVPIILP